MQSHVVLSLGEFAVSAAAALLLFALQREYPKRYLRAWIASWLAVTVFHLLEVVPRESESLVLAISILLTLSTLFGCSWLLFGMFEVSMRRQLGRPAREAVLIGCAIFVLLSYLAGVLVP